MNKKLKIALYMLLALIIVIAGIGIWYVSDYSHASPDANALLNGSSDVSVNKVSNGLLLDGPGNDSAVIFYPGAKIEYTAYLPLLMNLSADGVDCFLVEMPFNLAFLGANSADEIIQNSSYNYSNWYISGHSLGGVMASNYAHNHFDNLKGVILLAAYPADSLENTSVLSVYGSNDNVLNKEAYEDSKQLMPDNFTEYVIKGGNHAQFASYGNQSGDGVATISDYEQKNETIEEILDFLNEN
ncbi:MAG: alpha/beta fold hydrolase [Methanobrevibacter sp.]|nr:alpha/beta fold hydrolase [Methanobrevibacter sp.]